jgi:hypothetical protein
MGTIGFHKNNEFLHHVSKFHCFKNMHHGIRDILDSVEKLQKSILILFERLADACSLLNYLQSSFRQFPQVL